MEALKREPKHKLSTQRWGQSCATAGELRHDSTANAARHKAKLSSQPAPVTQHKPSLSSLTQAGLQGHCRAEVTCGHPETHRKHSRGQKQRSQKCERNRENVAGAAPAAQGGTGSIPAVTFSPQTEFRAKPGKAFLPFLPPLTVSPLLSFSSPRVLPLKTKIM